MKSLSVRLKPELAAKLQERKGSLSWNQYLKFLVMRDLGMIPPPLIGNTNAVAPRPPGVAEYGETFIARSVRGQ